MEGRHIGRRQGTWRRAHEYVGDRAIVLVGVVVVTAALADRALIRSDPGRLLFAPSAVVWIGVLLMVLVAVVAVVATGFYRRWTFWSPPAEERVSSMLLGTVVAVFVLVQLFAALTAVSAQSGWIGVSGFTYREGGRPSTSGFSERSLSWLGLGDPDIYQAMERQYAWHVLDAVPSLDLPQTLNWDSPRHELTGYRGGALALIFKLLVVLPAIALGVQLWKRARPGNARPSARPFS